MLCECCKKNEATIHITKIVNGIKKEANLCSECANKSGEFSIMPDMDMMTPFSFSNLLSGLIDYTNNTAVNGTATEVRCPNCGMTYREFREKGLLGCSQCYDKFRPYILSVLKGVQGNAEHIGKIPGKAGKNLVEKRKLLKLKEELKQAITLEEYEKAAEIRDEIKEIERNLDD